jgi:RND superfamily putative drug exporter
VVAIVVDAAIIRPLLVPALMKLLGRWNWVGPRRLQAVGHRLAAEPSLESAPVGTSGSRR